MRGIGVRFCAVLLMMLSVCVLAFSQTDRATITGTVKDQTGAILPGASISITNNGTGAVFQGQTNGDGIYSVTSLPVGTYTLEVRKPGFKTYTRTGISPVAGQVVTANISMSVGAASETVTVNGTPNLDVQNATEAMTMETKAIEELPLNADYGRNALNLLLSTAPNTTLASPLNPEGTQGFVSIAGGESFSNSVFIDGTNATAGNQGMINTPSQEGIAEMQLQTNVTDAALAGTGGGSMVFVLKSGTNKFHGSLYEILQNEDLNANQWVNNAFLSTCAPGDAACRSEYGRAKDRFNDFGGSAGGPIWKNHTFIFGDYEYYTQSDFRVNPTGATVPLTQMVTPNGSGNYDLSPLLTMGTNSGNIPNPNGSGPWVNPCTGSPYQYGQVFDPTTLTTVGGVSCASPFPNNQIPASRVSSISKKVAASYNQYYAPKVNRLIGGNYPSYLNSIVAFWKQRADVKLDHYFSDKHHISGSYNFMDAQQDSPAGSLGTLNGPFGGYFEYGEHSNGMARVIDNYTISPTLSNTFSVAWNLNSDEQQPLQNENISDWGFNWIQPTFPGVGFNDLSGLSNNGISFSSVGNAWDLYMDFNSYNYADTIFWDKGRHNIKFGWQWTAQQLNAGSWIHNDSAYYFESTTGTPAITGLEPLVGSPLSSMLLGDVDEADIYPHEAFEPRQKSMALFGQDDFRVKPNLTLNLGMRWDLTLPGHMASGDWENFDPSVVNPNWAPYGGAWVLSQNSGTTFEKDVPLYQFGPHLGASYAISPKLVARASYALSYVPLGAFSSGGSPYFPANQDPLTAASLTVVNNVQGGYAFNWDGYSLSPTLPAVNGSSTTSLGDVDGNGNLMYINPDWMKLGRVNSFFAGFQYELAKNVVLDTRYLGTFGRGLHDYGRGHDASWPTNWSAYDALLQSGQIYTPVTGAGSAGAVSAASGTTVPFPFASFSGPAYAAISPYPQLAEDGYTIQLIGDPALDAASNYNAFVAELKIRNTHGLYMDWNYTISEYTSDSSSGNWGVPSNFGDIWGSDRQSPNDNASWPVGDDQRQLAKGYFTYDLPFGRGQHWLSQSSILNSLVGGWTVGYYGAYGSGMPMGRISSPYQLPYYYSGQQRAFFANGANANNIQNQFHRHFNPLNLTSAGNADFSQSIVQTSSSWYSTNNAFFGDTPMFFNHWRWNTYPAQENMSLVKHFGIGRDGRYQAELRGEFYNIFNRHYFNPPDTNVNDSTFGYVTGTAGSSRVGQVTARLDW